MKMQGQKGKCKDDTKSESLDCFERVERSKMLKQTKTIITLSPNKIQEVRTYVRWAELRLQWAALLCLVSTVVCQPSAMATLALASLCTCKGKKRSEKKYVSIARPYLSLTGYF